MVLKAHNDAAWTQQQAVTPLNLISPARHGHSGHCPSARGQRVPFALSYGPIPRDHHGQSWWGGIALWVERLTEKPAQY